jgi:Lon protease-like protein
MVNPDLVAAIQNAIERNQTLESAMQSLLNAGYSREEVQEAARQVQGMQQKKISTAMPTPQATIPAQSQAKPANRKIILLIILLSILVLGIIAYLIIKLI